MVQTARMSPPHPNICGTAGRNPQGKSEGGLWSGGEIMRVEVRADGGPGRGHKEGEERARAGDGMEDEWGVAYVTERWEPWQSQSPASACIRLQIAIGSLTQRRHRWRHGEDGGDG